MTDMRLDDDPLSPTYGDVIYDNTGATTTTDQADSVAQKLKIKLSDLFPKSKGKHYGDKFIVVTPSSKPLVREFMKMTCVDCGTVVSKRPNSIFSGVIPCKCSKSHRHGKEHYISLIESKGFFVVSTGDKLTTDSIVTVSCKDCQKITKNKVSTMLSSFSCCKSQRYRRDRLETLQDIYKNLENSPCKLIEESLSAYPKVEDLVKVSCSSCLSIKEISIKSLIHRKVSCKCVADYGFNTSKLSFLYILKLTTSQGAEIGKLGITNNLSRRVKELSKANNCQVDIETLYVFRTGVEAIGVEASLVNEFCSTSDEIVHGKTETFNLSEIAKVKSKAEYLFMRTVYGHES